MSNKYQWWHCNLRSFKVCAVTMSSKSRQFRAPTVNSSWTEQTYRRTPNRIWWNQVPIRRAIYRHSKRRAVATRRLPQRRPLSKLKWRGVGLWRRWRFTLPPLALLPLLIYYIQSTLYVKVSKFQKGFFLVRISNTGIKIIFSYIIWRFRLDCDSQFFLCKWIFFWK